MCRKLDKITSQAVMFVQINKWFPDRWNKYIYSNITCPLQFPVLFWHHLWYKGKNAWRWRPIKNIPLTGITVGSHLALASWNPPQSHLVWYCSLDYLTILAKPVIIQADMQNSVQIKQDSVYITINQTRVWPDLHLGRSSLESNFLFLYVGQLKNSRIIWVISTIGSSINSV